MEFIKKDETYKIIESLEEYYIEGLYIISSSDESRVNINLKVCKKEDNIVTDILYNVFVTLYVNKKDQINMSVSGNINNIEGLSHVVDVINNCIEHFNPFVEQ